MGNPSYSSERRFHKAVLMNYASAPREEIFKQQKERKIHTSMDPKGVKIRESRDSVNHPNSVPIIIAMDVTGSMGDIPHQLVKTGLPDIMDTLIQKGVADPQILFLAIGDHECDNWPLQTGQFESDDENLDIWLTRSYLEGGGGGNAGESYLLPWYFAAFHTATDSFEKRGKKGFLFTIGDEPCLSNLPLSVLKDIMGEVAVGQANYTAEELLAKAQEKYNVYHLHIMQGSAGKRSLDGWIQRLGENCVQIDNHENVGKAIARIVYEHCDCADYVKSDTKSGTATQAAQPAEEKLLY